MCTTWKKRKEKKIIIIKEKTRGKRKKGREECSTTDVYLQCSGTHDHTSVYKLRQI